jgi:hypothetical protein
MPEGGIAHANTLCGDTLFTFSLSFTSLRPSRPSVACFFEQKGAKDLGRGLHGWSKVIGRLGALFFLEPRAKYLPGQR